MQIMPSKEAKNRFGTFLNTVQRQPVAITNHGRRVAVTLSAEDFEALGGDQALLNLQRERFRVDALGRGMSENDIALMLSEPNKKNNQTSRDIINKMQKQAAAAGLTQEGLDSLLQNIFTDIYATK